MRYRIKDKEIIYELTIPEGKNLKRGVIIFPGIPTFGNDGYAQILSEQGFYVLEPRYMGSWESYGKFSIDNCIKTVIEAENLFQRGSATECWGNKILKWEIEDIIIMSSSFGSAIVLSVAHSLKTKNLVCLAPLIDLEQHNKNNGFQEQDIKALGTFIKRGFENVYRGFNLVEWRNFSDGKLDANPMKTASKVCDKNMLFLHGKNDVVINYTRTIAYCDKIKNRNKILLKLYNKVGHGKQIKRRALTDIVKWINLTT